MPGRGEIGKAVRGDDLEEKCSILFGYVTFEMVTRRSSGDVIVSLILRREDQA